MRGEVEKSACGSKIAGRMTNCRVGGICREDGSGGCRIQVV